MEFYNVFDDIARDGTFRFLANRIQYTEQSGSFLQDKFNDIHTWREEYRELVKSRLFYHPPDCPFDGEFVDELDFGDYIRRKAYFNSAPGCRIPAYLLVPKGLKAPAPGIVVLHDHGAMFYWGKDKAVEHKDTNPVLERFVKDHYGAPLASTLARRGYVTLVIDSLFFGERGYKAGEKAGFAERLARFPEGSQEYIDEYNNCAFEIQSDLARAFFLAGWTFMGARMWDDIASVGFLSAQPEVNPGKIGCVGLSMGGYRSGWLAVMDDRIQCAVMAGAMQRYREMMKHRLPNVEWLWTVPGLYGIMDFDDVISLRAPKPLMAIHGKRDWLFTPELTGEKAIEKVKAVYEKAGAKQNFKYEYYNEPHLFSKEMQKSAFAWMDYHLK